MKAFASRLIDARNTVEGRILSVLLSVLLVASLFNVAVFTSKAVASGEDAEELDETTIEQVAGVEDPAEEVIEVPAVEEITSVVEAVVPESPQHEEPAIMMSVLEDGNYEVAPLADVYDPAVDYTKMRPMPDITGWSLEQVKAAFPGAEVRTATVSGDSFDIGESQRPAHDFRSTNSGVMLPEDGETSPNGKVSVKGGTPGESAIVVHAYGTKKGETYDGFVIFILTIVEKGSGALTYMPNGGNGDIYTVNGVAGTSTVIEECKFVRDGYVFSGWKDDQGNEFPVGSSFTFVKDATKVLYAQWEKKTPTIVPAEPVEPSTQVRYIVKWIADDGAFLKADDMTRSGNVGDAVSATDDDKRAITVGNTRYVFDKANEKNVLNGELKEIKSVDNIVVLKLYFAEDKNGNDVPDKYDPKYTVTYTDGVVGEEVFTDQVTSNILAGLATPKFDGTPTRIGYTFTGWNPTVAETVIANATYTAQWEKKSYTVSYDWGTTNVPPANKATLPSSAEVTYSDNYVVDTTYQAGGVIEVFDDYGNVKERYTFSGWKLNEQAAPATLEVTSNTVLKGSWSKETPEIKTWKVEYKWADETHPTKYPDGTEVKLPAGSTGLTNNSDYEIDSTFVANETTVNTFDDYGNVNGVYTFRGWTVNGTYVDGKILDNLSIDGKWEFEKEEVPEYTLKYEWTGLPNGKLYNDKGEEVTPVKPDSKTYVKGQPYAIDATMPGTEVYTHDTYGNQTARYELSAWDKTNGKMPENDVTVNAAWVKAENIDVPSYVVSYQYVGDVPANAPAYLSKPYSINQPVTIANKPGAIEGWEFEGWKVPEDITVKDNIFTLDKDAIPENKLVVITGEWKAVGVDDISVSRVEEYFDGKEHALVVSNALDTDKISFTAKGADFDNKTVNFTNGPIPVKVTVERNGVVIKTLETTSVNIKPVELYVELSGNAIEAMYDSEAHSVSGYTVDKITVARGAAEETLTELPEGVTFDIKERALEQVNVGTHTMQAYATDFKFGGENVKLGNYVVSNNKPTLTLNITPRPVIVTVNSATKTAGTADPSFSIQARIGEIYKNEVTFNLARTDAGNDTVGVHSGVITAQPVFANATIAKNYDVTVINGDLTVVAAPVPAVVVPGPGVAAPAPTEDITDDATPMAQNPEGEEGEGEEEIIDDENPLGAFDVKHCWTHWMMLLGMLFTAAYGIAVARRRASFTQDLEDFEKSVIGETAKARGTVTVRSAKHQAI